jgi:TolB-like protein
LILVLVTFFFIQEYASGKEQKSTIALLPIDTKNLNERELIKVEAFRTHLIEELKWISEISLTPLNSDQTEFLDKHNYKKAGRKLNVNYLLASEAISLPDGKTKMMLNPEKFCRV